MLFHSLAFILAFLPLCFAGFLLVNRFWGWQGGLGWLAAASLFFYVQWHPWLAVLLGASIAHNYLAARLMLRRIGSHRPSGGVLVGAISGNLTLLGYFKYANFFIDNANALLGTSLAGVSLPLPVGISFYTFVQIGLLVEIHNRQVAHIPFRHYLLFASFFPCVTAGPILLQGEMLPQFADRPAARFDATRTAVALTVFAIGLGKKLVLTDSVAPLADAVFDGVAGGGAASVALAWTGALAYTLQLYFDFSAYSDMALGAAYLFGLRLPLNFNSPLKATSIIDFWRRWHITMTRFFTNYLFSPIAIAMTRRAVRAGYGRPARFVVAVALPVTVTFVLAGLWHGAGWTFVVFGLIHGVALAASHGWREADMPALPPLVGWVLTMIVVIVGLVFFRSPSLPVAFAVLAAMAGQGSPATSGVLIVVDPIQALLWIAVLGAIALAAPNTQEILHQHPYSCGAPPELPRPDHWSGSLAWQPTAGWALVGGVLLAVALGSTTDATTFLYYQF
jgi:alginate O-acetyltransferase complex protein AlgI